MFLHLYWLDRGWKKKGYANNWNIVVDFNKEVFTVFSNVRSNYINSNSIEVIRKRDILDYKYYLKDKGFKEVNITAFEVGFTD